MRSKVSIAAVYAIAFFVGLILVLTEPGRSNPVWMLWAPLAVGLCLAEGAVLLYGVRRWAELCALQPVKVSEVAPWTTAAIVGSLVLINFTVVYPGPESFNWQNGALLSMAVLTGTPVGAVMLGVRRLAGNGTSTRTLGGQVAFLMSLRRLHQRLLGAVGLVVTLTALQAGALLKLERGLGTEFGSRPPEYVLIFGGVGSLIVGAMYMPGWEAISQQARGLSGQLFPLGHLTEASAILVAAQSQRSMDQLFGTDRGLVADLQSGVFILGPLITATIGYALK